LKKQQYIFVEYSEVLRQSFNGHPLTAIACPLESCIPEQISGHQTNDQVIEGLKSRMLMIYDWLATKWHNQKSFDGKIAMQDHAEPRWNRTCM